MARKWRLTQWLLVVALLLSACAAPAGPQKTAPSATSTLRPTNTPRATSTLRTTNTPQPTSTLRPTYTPRPTSTLRPTYTPRPTNTPRMTGTPSATSTPSATRGPTGTPAPTIPAAGLPRVDAGMVAALVRRLTASTSVADAVAATREALALGGLGTWDGQQFLVEAAAPAAAGFVIPEETVVLAMEARQRATAGHLTLAELGDMLQDFGWPFPENRIPGEVLRDIFQGWVSDGLAQPEDPLSFTPLFLREMALTQQPTIDLAQGDYDPEHLHLTLLELELFAAHFDRIVGLVAETTSSNRAPGLAMPAVQSAAPCSELKKWVESRASDAGQASFAAGRILVNINIVRPGLQAGLRLAGFSEGAAQQFGKALGALSIASKLWKLVALYSQAQVAVTVQDNPIHAPSSSEAKKTDTFRARAGVSDEDWQEYQQAFTSSDVVRGLRDCYSFYGLPVFPDLGDIAKEAKDWHVEWRLNGAPEWVRINAADNTFSQPGIFRVNLTPDGDHSAAAPLTVEILPEKGKTHSGPEKQATALASAAVHTAKPPSMMTWVNAIRGGLGNVLALSNALAELCAGWVAEMVPPKAYANLTVTYHESEAASWSGRVTYKKIKMEDNPKSGRDPWGEYAYTLYDASYWSMAATVGISSGKLRIDTGPEQLWDLSGSATVIFREEHLTDNWREDNGCKGGDVAVEHERSYSVTSAGGTAPVTETLTISSDGTYSLDFVSLPQVTGGSESQYDHWWENKPCVEDEKHTGYSQEAGASGPDFHIAGRLDPQNPGVLKGQYEAKDAAGYTVTITWNLRQTY